MPETPRDQALEYLQIISQRGSTNRDLQNFWNMLNANLGASNVTVLGNAWLKLHNEPTGPMRNQLAAELARMFAPPPPPPSKPGLKPEVAEKMKEAEDEANRQAQKQAERESKTVPPGSSGGIGGHWRIGGMEIHRHITRQRPGRTLASQITQTNRGLIPENWDRYCIDKYLYNKFQRGGVLVVDGSGSMNQDWPLVKSILKGFPNICVVKYESLSSSYPAEPGAPNGRACIIAEKGRWDEDFDPHENGLNQGNGVDVEALQLGGKLAAMYGKPLVWYSDGEACGGMYDDGTGKVKDLCDRELRKHKAVRCTTLTDALAWFERKPATHYLACSDRKPIKGRRRS